MIRALVYGLLTLGLLSLAVGWTMAGFWPVGIIPLVLIPLGLYLVKRKLVPTLSVALVLMVLFAAIGLWFKVSLFLALTTVLCALSAWDLDSFSRRLLLASALDDAPNLLERRHLLGVSLILMLGTGLSLLSRSIHLESSFEWTVVLVLFSFGGIGALVNWLRRKET